MPRFRVPRRVSRLAPLAASALLASMPLCGDAPAPSLIDVHTHITSDVTILEKIPFVMKGGEVVVSR